MIEKCDYDGCAKNVRWKVEWKFFGWTSRCFCDVHMNTKVSELIKKEYNEIRIKLK